MAAVIGAAFLLVAVLTIFGPVVEHAISTRIGAAGGVLNVVWWIAQWPILLGGLLVAFATLLYLGPDVDHPKWVLLTPGSLVAAALWIAASGLFAVYTATFSSYNKTWGSLSAVIVMLTWLWLTANALLLGAEINAELERAGSVEPGCALEAAVFLNRAVDRLDDSRAVHAKLARSVRELARALLLAVLRVHVDHRSA